MHPYLLIICVLVATCVIADRLVWLLIRWAPVLSLMDHPGERRIHIKSVPRVGGIAVFLALVAGIGLLYASGVMAGYHSHLGEGTQLQWLLVGAFVLVVVGVIDDRHDLSAWWKLGVEVFAATLIFVNTQRDFGAFMGIDVPWWIDYGIFVVWVVALINAFNLIDGMDGLCGGIGLIAIGILCLLSWIGPTQGDALILAVMAITLLAFLRYNFHPAKVFLGDAGSMLIGYFIATAGTLTVGRRAVVAGLLLPLLVAGVPLFDVLLAVWRRSARKLARGEDSSIAGRIFGADKDHLHHRLLSKGFGQRQVALLMYGLSLLLSLLALLPVLAGSNYLAFSLLGLIVTGLLGLRYIARIEVVATQAGFRASLKKPPKRGWLAVGFFVYDAVVLALAAAASLWLVERAVMHRWPLREWAILISTFVSCGLVGLQMGGANQRYWARAGLADAVSALGWFACGIGLSGILVTLFLDDLRYWLVLSHLAAGTLALFGLLVPRVVGVVVRESAVVAYHRRGGGNRDDSQRALLYGAGNMGELFVFWLGISRPAEWSNLAVVGFIDDQTSLRGRLIRGFPVLGTGSNLEQLATRHGIGCVVLTMSKLGDGPRQRLLEVAGRLGLEVLEWRPEMGLVRRVNPENVVQFGDQLDLNAQ